MTPNQIYAQTAIASQPWWDIWDLLTPVFRAVAIDDLDRSAASAAGDSTLMLKTHLWRETEAGRDASVHSLWLHDQPFAVITAGGRGGTDTVRAYVTDADLHRQAASHLMTFYLAHDQDLAAVDPDADVLGEFYTQKIVRHHEGLRLVDAGEWSEAGVRVLDIAALSANLSAAPSAANNTFDDAECRAEMVRAALAAVPDGIEAVAVDGIYTPGDGPPNPSSHWIAIALHDPSGEVMTVSQECGLLGAIGPGALALRGARKVRSPELRAALRFDGTSHAFDETPALNPDTAS